MSSEINEGDGISEFNLGNKARYAYKIESVYELFSPISLKILREMFSFTPPQAFSYATSYFELVDYIERLEKKLLF